MATYRYLTADLLSNTVIGELQLTGCSWGQALNSAGTFSGHMMLSDSRFYTEARQNMVPNSSFETNVTGWVAASVSLARTTSASVFGSASMQVTSLSASDTTARCAYDPNTSAEEGQTWTVSGYVKNTAGNTRQVRVYLRWFNAAGGSIATVAGTATTLSVGSDWTRISVTATAPANTASLDCAFYIQVNNPSTSNVLLIDGVLVEQSASLGSYIDGIANSEGALGTYNASNEFTLDYVTTPSKTGLYVERDGVIVWGGIIWARTYDSGSQTLSLVAREFESYFERRRITATGVGGSSGANVWATGTDQFTIVKKLVDDAQSVPYGNINITTSGIGSSGQGIANVLAIYDYEKRNLFDTILQLSQQNSPYGFDFNISCAYDGSYNLTRTLNLYYPRKGTAISANYNNPMLEFPSVMVSYSYPEDGSSLVNQLFGIGPGTNEGQYISTAFSGSSFTAGFPLLEDVASFTNVPDPRMVDQLTGAQVVARGVPVTVMTASWVPTDDPVTGAPVAPNIGDFTTGDFFRIRITDDRFPNTLETALRLSKFDVRVGDDGSSELVTGTFVIPTY